jgi:glucose-6-phosphate 1-dehydrogenase
MQAGMVGRLIKGGHDCVVYALHPAAIKRLHDQGAIGAVSLKDLVGRNRNCIDSVHITLAETFDVAGRTVADVIVQLKPPLQRLFADSASAAGWANYLCFRPSPSSAGALAARAEHPGQGFLGEQRELYVIEEQPGEEALYERLLGDAVAGDGALSTREDAVEAAWAVVAPVLAHHQRARPYPRHSCGARHADVVIAPDGGWHNPKTAGAQA